MQFSIAAVVAVMASAVAAQSTVTVYACSTSSGVAAPTSPPVASTGVPPTPTGLPQFTGAASMNGPALGLLGAAGLALFL